MKNIILIIIISVSFFGCVNPGKSYIEADYQNAKVALPELLKYLSADEKLTDLDKEIRIKTVKDWFNLIVKRWEKMKNGEK